MGWLPRFLRSSPPVEERAVTVGPANLQLTLPYSGERVTPATADTNTAVGRAVQLISNDLAKVPLKLMRRTATGSEEDTSSALWRLFDTSPNVEQSGFEWRRYMTSLYCLYGNSYCLISRNGRGDVLQLLPLDPTSISVVIDPDGTYYYDHATLGKLEPEEVLHFRFGLLDETGVTAYSPITRARESLGLAKAQEIAGASVYRNAATPRMCLKHPGTLSDKAAARLSEQFTRAHAGPDSAGKAILLEEGMDADVLQPLQLETAQWLDARGFSIDEVSRIYGIPTPYLSEHSNSTYNNVSSLVKMYVDSCLSHHASIWAAEIQLKMLSPDQYLDFDLSYVQRGTFSEEILSLHTAVTSGIMTPNECRKRLGLNPLDGLDRPLMMPGATTLQGRPPNGRDPRDTDPDS